MNRDSLASSGRPPPESQAEAQALCSVVDHWPVGMAWLDPADRLVAVNQTLCQWWQTSRAALLGRSLAELWLGDEGASGSAAWDADSFEHRLVRPDGSVMGLYGHCARLASAQGEALGRVVVLVDVTERLVTEHSLREADRHKTEFLSVLSHELRNPLAPLRTALALLQRESMSARGGQALEIAQRQLGQCIRIVDDLLDTSRLSQGKMALHIERVLLNRVLRAVLENTQAMRTERAQTLHLMGLDQAVWLNADPARLQQIFENIMINASKYTDPQGRITVAVSTDLQHVTVSISDTGVGVAPDQLPQMFEIFKQVAGQPGRNGGGLGIGLALVKQLVELHGGQVAMHSAGLGQGCTVTLRLPYRARRLDEPPPETRCRAGWAPSR